MSDKIQELKMNELKDLFFYTLGIVPLQNYGVVGDGMTDNRLKIQQAIYDAIEVKAKYIFVPKGNYYYSQELFRRDEVAWLGNSIDAYIKGVEIKQFPSFDNVVNITDEYSENKQDTYSATYINKQVENKVDKVEGKDLSTNDFTDEYKQKIDSINIYSATEQVVGTWIDGKTIYRKILTFESINANSTKQIEVDINIDNLVNILSIVKTTDETFRTIPTVAPGYNTYNIGMFYSISTNSVYIQTPSQVSIASGYIAIEYTKTTD